MVSPGCQNRVIDQAVAPGGRLKAVVYERRCEHPPALSTQVALLPAEERLPDAPGNVFAAGSGGQLPTTASFVTVAWTAPTKLSVSVARGAAVMKVEPKVGGVDVKFFWHD